MLVARLKLEVRSNILIIVEVNKLESKLDLENLGLFIGYK